jgi:hypothetical protein
MRSSATAPCLATSNASRNDLASLNSASRASALLSRVASYSSNRQGIEHETSFHPSERRKDYSSRGSSPHIREGSSRREKEGVYVGDRQQGMRLPMGACYLRMVG